MFKILVMLGIVLMPLAANAQSTSSSGRSESKTEDAFKSPIALNPRLGMFSYTNVANLEHSGVLAGINALANVSDLLGSPYGLYFGAMTGLSYTTVNGPTDDAGLFIAPINAIVGYPIMNNLIVAAHGGGNVYFQTTTGKLSTDDSNFELHPNVGADVSYSVSPDMSITAGLDWTLKGTTNPLLGYLGLAFPLA